MPSDPMAGLAESIGKPGWHYRDLPNMSPESWEKLKAIIGGENIEPITWAERTWPDGKFTVRGQILISPEGLKRMQAHKEATQ